MARAQLPQIDVVVPVYNVQEWLPAFLDSLLAQDFHDWRALIILDGPTDDSGRIAHDFAARERRIEVHAFENAGLGAARNRGLKLATADYVMFCDSDDVLPPGSLGSLLTAALTQNADITTGRALQSVDMREFWPYWSMTERPAATEEKATSLESSPSLVLDHTAWNKLYARSFLLREQIRYPEGTTCEDVVPSIRAYCRAERVAVIDDVVYIHRRRPGSITTSGHFGPSALRDWAQQVLEAARVVDELNSRSVARAFYGRMLRQEAWTRAARWHEFGLSERQIVREVCRRLLLDEEAQRISLDERRSTTYRLILEDDQPAVSILAVLDAPMPTVDTLAALGRVRAATAEGFGQVLSSAWYRSMIEPLIRADSAAVGAPLRAAVAAMSRQDLLSFHPFALAFRDAIIANSLAPLRTALSTTSQIARVRSRGRALEVCLTVPVRCAVSLVDIATGERSSLTVLEDGFSYMSAQIRPIRGISRYVLTIEAVKVGDARTEVALDWQHGRQPDHPRRTARLLAQRRHGWHGLELVSRPHVLRRACRRLIRGFRPNRRSQD